MIKHLRKQLHVEKGGGFPWSSPKKMLRLKSQASRNLAKGGLTFLLLFLFGFQSAFAHAVQVGYAVLSNGFIRVYIEHWHGDQTTATLVNNGMSITSTYGSNTVTQNVNPTGAFNNTAWNNLPGAGAAITILAQGPSANQYSDWAYYDFAPAACNVPVNITLNGGLTVVLEEENTSLWPRTISRTFNDTSGPTITPANTTASVSCNTPGTNVNFSATAIDNCSPNVGVTFSTAPGSYFPVGTTNVIATATDGNGNTSQLTFPVTVNVVDNTPPTIMASGNIQAFTNDPGPVGTAAVNLPNSGVFVPVNGNTRVNFQDPLPAGAIVTGATVNYTVNYSYSCCISANDLTVSGTNIGSQYPAAPAGNKNLTVDYTGSLPGYVHGGTNFFQLNSYWNGVTFHGGSLTLKYQMPGGGCEAFVTVPVPTTADNCGVASVTNSFNGTGNASGKYPKGTTTITWTVTDISGKVAITSQTVIVTDNTKPTITAPAAVNVFAYTGSCAATGVALGTAIIADNCSGAGTTNNAPSSFPVGTTTVTWTATDAAGNTATATQLVTVSDNQLPTIFAPANIVVSTDQNLKTASNVALGSPVTADNCTVANVANNAPAAFPLGNTTVTWTVTDAAGNSATATQTVTVNDTQAPNAMAKNIVVNLDAAGMASVTPADVDNGSTDNVGVTSLSFANPNLIQNGDFNNGTNFWYSTWIDGNGGYRNPGGNPGAYFIVNDNGKFNADPTMSQNVSGLVPGQQYEISGDYRNFDGGPAGVLSFGVLVNDQLVLGKPLTNGVWMPFSVVFTATQTTHKITFAGERLGTDTNYGIDNLSVKKAGVGNGTSLSFNCSNKGVNPVTLVATDAAGNLATAPATVTVVDAIFPTISAPAAVSVLADNGSCAATNVALGTPVAADNCSYNVTNDAPASFPVSNTTVTWTVTDASGNATTATQLVTVTDNQNPTITAPANVVASNDNGNCDATVSLGTPVTADNCAVATVTNDHASSTFPVGTTTVTWTVTDIHGNIATATQTVTVNDTENPVVATQAITVQLDATGAASITTADINNGSADNCGISTYTLDKTTFDCSNVGTNTVTLTVTDIHNNVAAATAVVTVQDNVAPVALAQNLVLQLDATGNGSVTAAQVNNGSNDACGIKSVALSQTAFDCSHVGPNTVTLTVTDNNDNVSATTAVITVKDEVAPVALAKNATVQLDANGNGSISAAEVNNGSNDACGIASLTVSPTTFTCANVGPNPVTLTVTDNNGNVSVANATVTVEDNVAPVAIAKNISVTLKNGIATITAADVNNGSNDACGIANMVVSQTSFDCSNLGANPVTLTVTDNNSNVSVTNATVTVIGAIPTPAIAVSRSNSTFTGANMQKTIFLGYGAQNLTLTCSNNTSAAYASSYKWTGNSSNRLSNVNAANPVFTPTSAGTYTFTALCTNEFGCQRTAQVTVEVIDAVCGNKGDKVLICHNGNEICVSPSAIPAHLAHAGDYLGSCNATTRTTGAGIAKAETEAELNVFPNPFSNATNLEFTLAQAGNYQVQLIDMKGALVKVIAEGEGEINKHYSHEINGENMPTGMYIVRLISASEVKHLKIMLKR
jgi:hypothetical protein